MLEDEIKLLYEDYHIIGYLLTICSALIRTKQSWISPHSWSVL